MTAILALPEAPRAHDIDDHALAPWAERLAAIVSPPDRLERGMSLIVTHPHNTGQDQSPGFGAQEVMLAHD